MVGFVQKVDGKDTFKSHQVQCFYGVLGERKVEKDGNFSEDDEGHIGDNLAGKTEIG